MKMGMKIEYWVIDETGQLYPGQEIVDSHSAVVPELVAPLIEIQTPPLEDVTATRHTLQTLQSVLAVAAAHDKQLVPLDTPLTTASMPVTTARGQILEQIYGERIEYAKHCAGTTFISIQRMQRVNLTSRQHSIPRLQR